MGIKFAFLYQLLLPNYLTTTIHHVNAGMLSLFGEQGINTKVTVDEELAKIVHVEQTITPRKKCVKFNATC